MLPSILPEITLYLCHPRLCFMCRVSHVSLRPELTTPQEEMPKESIKRPNNKNQKEWGTIQGIFSLFSFLTTKINGILFCADHDEVVIIRNTKSRTAIIESEECGKKSGQRSDCLPFSQRGFQRKFKP